MKFGLCGVLGACITCGLGCAGPAKPPPEPAASPKAQARADDDVLVQFSLVSALAAGDFSEVAPLRSVLASGDFGVGTFDHLNGEMVVLDGQIYQALADGTTRPANLDGSTPFAAVTFFQADGRLELKSAKSLADLDQHLDRRLPRQNVPYALRIHADFSELTLRSVPEQSPPFKPLVEVVKHQATWQHQDLRGTLVGLRYPEWIGTLNVAGYHWHFLSDDKAVGGHVLACAFENGTVQYDECTSLLIHIPTSKSFEQFESGSVEQQDIHDIERQR